jgi:hypothetical protein
VRTDRELPFPVPLDYAGELRGRLPESVAGGAFALVDEAVSMLVLPFAYGADGLDAADGLERAVDEYVPLRTELLDLFEKHLGGELLASIRRGAVAHAARTLRMSGWKGAAADAATRALNHCELLTELAIACPERRAARGAEELRRQSARLELCLLGAVSVAGGVISGGRRERVETLAVGALLAARRVHALLLGAAGPESASRAPAPARFVG